MKAPARSLLVCATLLGAVAWVQPASSQGFDVQQLNPMPGQRVHFISQPSARPNHQWMWELGLLANYADDPLVVVDGNDTRVGSVVGGQLPVNLMAFVAPLWWLELGLDVPLIVYQSGEEIAALPDVDGSNNGFGVGDVRFLTKFVLFTQEEDELDNNGFSLALQSDLFLPSGDSDAFQGGEFRVAPRLVADYAWSSGYRISSNIGYTVRDSRTLRNVDIDDDLRFALAANIPVGNDVHVVPEVKAGVNILAADLEEDDVPAEGLVGLKYLGFGDVLVEGGAGLGLNAGVGTPDWRAFFGLSYQPTPEEEPIVAAYDPCPGQSEDIDGFEDNDGCPDPDNDQDGILDVDDSCPMDPEDKDGFEDSNGCPDPDNDQDGILDVVDACPLEPEVFNQLDDEDGCPDAVAAVVPPKPECDERLLKQRKVIYFESASADVNSWIKRLDEVAQFLIDNPEVKRVRIEGHTDDVGGEKFNQKLSVKRVTSAREHLAKKKGIKMERMDIQGFGESKPAVSIAGLKGGALMKARAKNRRVELIILEVAGCKE